MRSCRATRQAAASAGERYGLIEKTLTRIKDAYVIHFVLDGTNAEEGRAILEPHVGDALVMEPTMLAAAEKAVALKPDFAVKFYRNGEALPVKPAQGDEPVPPVASGHGAVAVFLFGQQHAVDKDIVILGVKGVYAGKQPVLVITQQPGIAVDFRG